MELNTKVVNLAYNDLIEIINQHQFIIIDQNVHSLYQTLLQDYNSEHILSVAQVEEHKNMATFEKLCLELIQKGIRRNHKILAIGGGALTDLSGFVAMSVLRGIEINFVPTTILNMIDASVGGKVGINCEYGKNLIGGFYPAQQVYLCDEFLKTLPVIEVASAQGEFIKYLFLDAKIHQSFVKNPIPAQHYKTCLDYKMAVCRRDPLEKSERYFLNLGHTFGHALEFLYKLPHGIAVAIGLEWMLKMTKQELLLVEYRKLVTLLKLESDLRKAKSLMVKNFDPQAIAQFLLKDKKNNQHLRFVVLSHIGKAHLKEFSLETVVQWLEQHARD
jgi:3-dehydroquinate synthase